MLIKKGNSSRLCDMLHILWLIPLIVVAYFRFGKKHPYACTKETHFLEILKLCVLCTGIAGVSIINDSMYIVVAIRIVYFQM